MKLSGITKSHEKMWALICLPLTAPPGWVKIQGVVKVFWIPHHVVAGDLNHGSGFDHRIGPGDAILSGTPPLQVPQGV